MTADQARIEVHLKRTRDLLHSASMAIESPALAKTIQPDRDALKAVIDEVQARLIAFDKMISAEFARARA